MQSQNQNYGAVPSVQTGVTPGQYPGAPAAAYRQQTHQGAFPAGYGGTAHSGYPQPAGQAPPQPAGQAPPPGYPGSYSTPQQPGMAQVPAGYGGTAQSGYPQPAGQAPPPGYPGSYATPQQPGMAQAIGPAPPDEEIMPQYKGPVPDADVEDNPNAAAAVPSAPPLEKMDSISGYQNTGFNASVAPPPSYDEAMAAQEPTNRTDVSSAVAVTEEEARAILLDYVSQFCCYGKGTATDMKITDIKSTSAFHYTLESYCEARSTEWAYEAYTGQVIDGPQNGVAPRPWDIQAQLPELFKDSKLELEVPHTASIKPCHHCGAMGMIPCHRCYGRGAVRCTTCHGRGHKRTHRGGEWHDERCHWCHGRGRRRCITCHGVGLVPCSLCLGNRNLKCYIKLTILWKDHLTDHIVERTDLPDHLIRTVTGQTAFEETHPRVWPINHFPDEEVNSASRTLIGQHAQAYPSERMHHQRHRVRIVPVSQIFYTWKEKQLDFFVYGIEHKVHAPTYPQTCCCGCSIL